MFYNVAYGDLTRTDILVGLIAIAFIASTYLRNRRSVPYPPGPRGIPLLGNLFDLPTQWEHMEYAKWSKEYNAPLVHFHILGTHVIIVNDADAAHELFEKRSALYVDRPRLTMLNEVAGFDWAVGFSRAGETWRSRRRHLDSFLRESEAKHFRRQEQHETLVFLKRLLGDPGNVQEQLKLFSAGLVLETGYGIEVDSQHDKFVSIMENGCHILNAAGNYAAVDMFPWLQHFPSWLPGMSWKEKTKNWKKEVHDMRDIPYEHVKESVKNGSARPSVALSLIEKAEARKSEKLSGEISEEDISSIGATLYIAGTDTTGSILASLFVILIMFPDVQRKAQEELDRVVGRDRLPSFSDKADLPYIHALCLELLRWTCIVPLGSMHSIHVDDVYEKDGKQYFIPKGSTIIGNSWAICNDERLWSSPEMFKPERFINSTGLDPDMSSANSVFGFIPRICPGRWMAHDTQFIMTASVISCFQVDAADEIPKTFQEAFEPGFVLYPKKIKCSIKPRSKEAIELISQTE